MLVVHYEIGRLDVLVSNAIGPWLSRNQICSPTINSADTDTGTMPGVCTVTSLELTGTAPLFIFANQDTPVVADTEECANSYSFAQHKQ